MRRALYECLIKSIFHLPSFLRFHRFDSTLTSKNIVVKVFRAVIKSSGAPVINRCNRHRVRMQISSPPQSKVIYRFSQVPELLLMLTQDHLLAKSNHLFMIRCIMKCLFAASPMEGVGFQNERARGESRLKLFMAY